MKIIPDWRQAWRYYSVWGLAALAALPDLYNTLAFSGLFYEMPEPAKWFVRIGATTVMFGRFVQQSKPPEKAHDDVPPLPEDT